MGVRVRVPEFGDEEQADYLHACQIIAHKVFITSFCKSQFPHKSVNLSSIITSIKDKLTDLCGN